MAVKQQRVCDQNIRLVLTGYLNLLSDLQRETIALQIVTVAQANFLPGAIIFENDVGLGVAGIFHPRDDAANINLLRSGCQGRRGKQQKDESSGDSSEWSDNALLLEQNSPPDSISPP